MKRFFILSISVIIAALASITAYASECVTVKAERNMLKLSSGEEIRIPFIIKDNTGLMGFGIEVFYPSQILTNPEVERGSVVSKGNFNSSISSQTDGHFNIIWNSSSDICENGELFTLIFTADDNAQPGEYKITLNYSRDDTFNEKWEEVILDIEDIAVEINGNTTVVVTQRDEGLSENKEENTEPSAENITETSAETEPTVSLNEETMSDSAGETAVMTEKEKEETVIFDIATGVLDEMNIPSVEAVPEEKKEEFSNKVSKILSEGTGKEESISFDEIKQAVTGGEKIVSDTAKEVLENMNLPSIEAVPEEEKEEFAKEVSKTISQKVKKEISFSFEEIEEASVNAEKETHPQEKTNGRYIIPIAAAAIFVLTVSVTVFKFKKKNNLPA